MNKEKPKLLDQLREAIRLEHYSLKIKNYTFIGYAF